MRNRLLPLGSFLELVEVDKAYVDIVGILTRFSNICWRVKCGL